MGVLMKNSHGGCNAFVGICIAEVRHDRNFIDLRQRIQTCPSRSKCLWGKPQSVHTRIYFEEYAMALVCFVNGQHVDLGFTMNDVPQIKSRAQLQIACFKNTLKQKNGTAPAQLPNTLGL